MRTGSDRKYTAEFRDAAVRQVLDGGRGQAEVARALEVSSKTLAISDSCSRKERGNTRLHSNQRIPGRSAAIRRHRSVLALRRRRIGLARTSPRAKQGCSAAQVEVGCGPVLEKATQLGLGAAREWQQPRLVKLRVADAQDSPVVFDVLQRQAHQLADAHTGRVQENDRRPH